MERETIQTSPYGSVPPPHPKRENGGNNGEAPAADDAAQGQQRYRSLAEATSSIVWIADPRGAIVAECPTWAAFTGQTFEQYRGLGWIDAIHPDDRAHTRELWDAAQGSGKRFEAEYRLHHHDGSWRNMLVHGAPVRNDQGRVREWIGTCTDISDRARIEEALREEVRINDILYQVGMSLVAELDLEKLLQRVTDAATRVIRARFGAFFLAEEELDQTRLALFCLSGATRESFAGYPTPRPTAIFGPIFRGEGVMRIDDVPADPRYGKNPPYNGMPPGHPPVRSYLGVPVMTASRRVIGALIFGHPDPGVFNARDERIVRGIAAQAAIAIDNATLVRDIREAQEHLEQLVGARTSELRIANAQLRASNRELEDFASVASHDLQEPLRKIQAFGDRLELRAGPNLGPEGLDYLHRMRKAAGRMQTLIADLLQFSRVTTRAQASGLADLNQIAAEVVGDLEARIEQTGGSVKVAALPAIQADPMQMRQLLQNLIANALKFRKPHEAPAVRVHVELDRAGGMCRIMVEDNGIGFDEKYLDRIFNVFQRLHARGTYEGTGIGLAVCRKIAERHGGSITAKSKPDVGSTFIVALPWQPPILEKSDA